MKAISNSSIRLQFAVSALATCISIQAVSAGELTWSKGDFTGSWNITDTNRTGSISDIALFNIRNETATLTEAITWGSLSFITKQLLAPAHSGEWANFVLGPGTSVTVTSGDFHNSFWATHPHLNGNTLTISSTQACKYAIIGGSNFNGTTDTRDIFHAGAGMLTMTGMGSLTLSGANTFIADTTLSVGTLVPTNSGIHFVRLQENPTP